MEPDEPDFGTCVWARFGSKWWPGVVAKDPVSGRTTNAQGQWCVLVQKKHLAWIPPTALVPWHTGTVNSQQ